MKKISFFFFLPEVGHFEAVSKKRPNELGRRLAFYRVQLCALGGMLCELGFAKLLARELFGLARLWVEYFFLFGVLLRFFCRCHDIATDRRLARGGSPAGVRIGNDRR